MRLDSVLSIAFVLCTRIGGICLREELAYRRRSKINGGLKSVKWPAALLTTETHLHLHPLPLSMSAARNAPAVESELTVATRRLMQAEENTAQAGARVLQQWNMVQTILRMPPNDRHIGELESSQAALEFAKAAHTDAKQVMFEAKLDKAQAVARADSAASANAVCNSRRPIAIGCKRRHADDDDDDDDERDMGARENAEKEREPAEKRSKSSSSLSSSLFSASASSSSSSASSSLTSPPSSAAAGAASSSSFSSSSASSSSSTSSGGVVAVEAAVASTLYAICTSLKTKMWVSLYRSRVHSISNFV
jgi:hypothetical protein